MIIDRVLRVAQNFHWVTVQEETISKVPLLVAPRHPGYQPEYDRSDILKTVTIELRASAINYCYWYGSPFYRPAEGAGKMYQLVETSYGGVSALDLKTALALQGFPLTGDRLRHIDEVSSPLARDFINALVWGIQDHSEGSLDVWIGRLLRLAPGFANDMFLKRVFLFFHQLNRRLGAFADEIERVPIPADYQVPKMLRSLGYIYYHPRLWEQIQNKHFFPENSAEEIQIRAASIIACKLLAEQNKCTMGQVDEYLWSSRDLCDDPFHLTVTTNY